MRFDESRFTVITYAVTNTKRTETIKAVVLTHLQVSLAV